MKDERFQSDWQPLGTSAYVWRKEGETLHLRKRWHLGNTIGIMYGLACIIISSSDFYLPVLLSGIGIVSIVAWSFCSRHSIVVSKNGLSIGRRKIAVSKIESIAVVARRSDSQWPISTPIFLVRTQSGGTITVLKDLFNLDASILSEVKTMMEAALDLDRKDSPA